MKKLLTLLIAGMMLISLSACQKKTKKVIVNIYGSGQDAPNVYTSDLKAETIKDVLDGMSSPDLFEATYEETAAGLVITSIKSVAGTYDAKEATWQIEKNGQPIVSSIDKETVADGDVIDIRYSVPEEKKEEPLLGGWQLFDKFNVVLTQEEKEIFEKATADMLSVKYEPIRVIATQVVNGTNYAYLVAQSKVVENPSKEFYIIKIYRDLEGNVDFKAINKLDPVSVVAKNQQEQLAGGWEVAGPDNSGILLDENAQASFNKAVEAHTGVNLQPIQLLASQIVNGTNYIALCKGQTVSEKPINGIYIVTWHADLNGDGQITDVALLDLAYYTTGE